jgi:hypothetical protein
MPANPDIEQNQAVELAKAKAESRRQKQEENIAETESRRPKEEEAELLPQEYGMPTEEEQEGPTEEEQAGEEEAEEGEEPEEGYGEEAQINEEMLEATLTKAQMKQLKIQRAISIEEREATKKIKKIEKELKISEVQDRTKNAIKIIRVMWGLAIVYWWLLLIPIVFAFFVTIALGTLVWGCGINFGSYSMRTKQLQKNIKNEKKMIIRRKKERIKKIQKSMS